MPFMRDAISKVACGGNLSGEEARVAMSELMDGAATPAQIGSLLTALRMKGETVEEIAAFATIMREHARKIEPRVSSILTDTCGTGGDVLKTFNISTIAALVISGAGAPIAKHGNRSFTGKCGSADLLERLGVNLNAEPEKVKISIEQAGIGFLFAPMFHAATKNVAIPRKEIGIRTVFNLLGPLTNPASARAQLLGVYENGLVVKTAEVLRKLGVERAIVVHGVDGFDEVSLIGKTRVARLENGNILEENLTPASFGLEQRSFGEISAAEDGVEEHALTALRILHDSGNMSKKDRAVREMILANASAGLVAAGKAGSYPDGVEMARDSLETGKAFDKLNQLVKYSGGDSSKIESLLAGI
ncbi:MAG: anthranilate phosphoribosyltransferase [Nitrososphaerales archaeon]